MWPTVVPCLAWAQYPAWVEHPARVQCNILGACVRAGWSYVASSRVGSACLSCEGPAGTVTKLRSIVRAARRLPTRDRHGNTTGACPEPGHEHCGDGQTRES
jgi:hypothetical protein